MPGFFLHTSNRIEYCAETLAEIIAQDPLPPMEPETIVIPSGGMERFIAFSLVEKLQICANIDFPFPNAFIQSIFQKVFTEIPERSLYSPEMLTWQIMAILPSQLKRKEFELIRQYISNDPDQIKLFQLSRKIADLFDHYTIFRPEMLYLWESGKTGSTNNEKWQALLWKVCVDSIDDIHRVALREKFFNTLKQGDSRNGYLPRRISMFGISYLPAFHAEILHALSRYIDIHCFTLNPCRHFWDDIVSEKYKARKSVQSLQVDMDFTALHYETGNNLLASLGAYGREFLSLLHTLDCEESSEFFNPAEDNMLGILQSDILNLRTHDSPRIIPDHDKSLQIQVCHSPLREIEVLHNAILSFFEQDATLTPNDIIVMIPDIEGYAPFIHTVFDTASDTDLRIPFSIADMTTRNGNTIINDFFAILNLKKNRFSAAGVLSILESDAVSETWGIGEDARALIYSWVEKTAIRWGIDEQDRELAGMPGTGENTWQAGLDRLFLGYAMAPHGDMLFESILPYDTLDSSDAEALGTFASFLEKLFCIVRQIDSDRTLSEWADFLLSVCTTFFTSNESNDYHLEMLRQAIQNLSLQGQKTGYPHKISFTIIRTYFESLLSKKEYGKGFMTGGVTFCTMLPMRSVPFKILCMVGMNDGTFPRREPSVSFNLIASHQQPGDRSVRKEDRYCFLESLLSAREKLYISYTGHNITDNSTIPPSVLISELTDYLSRYYALPDKITESLIDHITTHHRLNAFNTIYFKEHLSKFFSYSPQNADAASAGQKEPPVFLDSPLPLPDDHDRHQITLEQLGFFLTHPVKYFCKNRLDIVPASAMEIILDTEPFSIDGLEKYLLEQKLLEHKLSGESLENYYAPVKARGILPHGTAGSCAFNRICEDTDRFSAPLAGQAMHPSGQKSLAVDLSCAGFTITGSINLLTQDNLVHFRPAGIKAKDRLRSWLSHLVLALIRDDSLPETSLLLGRDSKGYIQSIQFTKPDNADTMLTNILHLYEKGLAQPIPFFPATSYEYAQHINRGKSEEFALQKAHAVWHGNQQRRGESNDAYYAFFPGNHDPFSADFAELAMQIYQPIFLHEQAALL